MITNDQFKKHRAELGDATLIALYLKEAINAMDRLGADIKLSADSNRNSKRKPGNDASAPDWNVKELK